jgi:hypothetical protein
LSVFWPFVDRVAKEAVSQLAAQSSMAKKLPAVSFQLSAKSRKAENDGFDPIDNNCAKKKQFSFLRFIDFEGALIKIVASVAKVSDEF